MQRVRMSIDDSVVPLSGTLRTLRFLALLIERILIAIVQFYAQGGDQFHLRAARFRLRRQRGLPERGGREGMRKSGELCGRQVSQVCRITPRVIFPTDKPRDASNSSSDQWSHDYDPRFADPAPARWCSDLSVCGTLDVSRHRRQERRRRRGTCAKNSAIKAETFFTIIGQWASLLFHSATISTWSE